ATGHRRHGRRQRGRQGEPGSEQGQSHGLTVLGLEHPVTNRAGWVRPCLHPAFGTPRRTRLPHDSPERRGPASGEQNDKRTNPKRRAKRTRARESDGSTCQGLSVVAEVRLEATGRILRILPRGASRMSPKVSLRPRKWDAWGECLPWRRTLLERRSERLIS